MAIDTVGYTPNTPPEAALPEGWVRTSDHQRGVHAYLRTSTFSGPASTLDDAVEAVEAWYASLDHTIADGALTTSRTPGAAVAEIRADYSTKHGSGGGEDEPPYAPETVTDDTYQLTPAAYPTPLSSHPIFAQATSFCDAIDTHLQRGDRASAILAALTDAAKTYLALRLRGVQTWDAIGYTWTCVRHYSATDADAVKALIAGDVAKQGSVFAWGDVEGHAAINEPTWTDASGAAQSYEWRCTGVAPALSGDEYTVTYTYQAAWAWAKALYDGGSWDPPAPTA